MFPTHPLSGSNKARQEVGDPGHCERCAEFGHVRAHRNLGCGDVGCNSAHGPDDPRDRARPMTADQPPPAAVQIAAAALGYETHSRSGAGRDVVAALDRAGWLTPPDRVAALEAVAAAAGAWRDWLVGMPFAGPEHDLRAALAALDAAPAGTTTEGDPPPPGAGLPILCP